MPVIREGDIFPTLKDFKAALRQWAIENNWTPHILDSDSHRVRAGCRSTKDCPFRVRANYSGKRRNALVTTCDDVHNCYASRADGTAGHQNIKRAETGKLKFLLEAVPKLMNVTLDTNVQDIIDAVEKKHGQRIPTRQAQKVKSELAPRIRGPCRHCQQIGHTRKHCPQLNKMMDGPPDFHLDATMDDTMDMTGADGESDNGAYADGGLEPEFGNGDHPTDDEGGQETQVRLQQAVTREHPHGQQTLSAIDPNLDSGYQAVRVSQQSQTNPYDSQLSQQALPTDNATPHTPPPNRPSAEVRVEAAKLMQSAAVLMEQAAKMNAEAARLYLSVAHT